MSSRIIGGSLVLALTSIMFVALVMPTLAGVPHSTIVIDNFSVSPGGTATVSITITEAENNVSSIGPLYLTYNTGVVKLLDVTNSDFENFFWNEPAPGGQVIMVGFQNNASLSAPVKVADLTFLGVGSTGTNTSLELAGSSFSFMSTGSPHDVTLRNGFGYIVEGVPVFTTPGMVALVGVLALVLVVTVRRKR